MTTPIKLIADCEIKAADAKRVPTVEIVAYNGDQMTVPGYGRVVLSLAAMELATVPLLADHDNQLNSVAGSGTPSVVGNQLVVTGTLASGTPAGEQILALHRAGVRLQASVGCEPQEQQFVAGGESINANGRTIVAPKGGLTHVTKSVLREVSFVACGADRHTSVSIAAKFRGKTMDSTSPCKELSEFVATTLPSVDQSSLTENEWASLNANMEGRSTATPADFQAVAPMILASADPVVNEQTRLNQIDRATSGEWGEGFSTQVNQLRAAAIGGELSVDDLLAQLRPIRAEQFEGKLTMPSTIHAPRNGGMDSKIIEAAFAMNGGLSNVEKVFDEKTLECADRIRATVSLAQITLAEAARNGYPLRPGEGISQGNLRSVLAHAFAPIRGAASFSTVSLPETFSNVANLYLRAGWMSVDQTILRISSVRPVDNFKEIKTVSLLGGMEFQPVGADGELRHGQLGETFYGNKADTYGILSTITRTDFINDDLNALTAIPKRIGRGGMLKLNDLGWREFLDNATFFSVANKNLTGSELNDVGLDWTESRYNLLEDPDGQPLGVPAKILLVPPTQKTMALKLLGSVYVTGIQEMPSGNIWRNRFVLESSPYMENPKYAGSSSQCWYLLASPGDLPVLEIVALNGRVEPTIETAEANFNVLGVELRGFSDIGIRRQEHRGGIKADGTLFDEES